MFARDSSNAVLAVLSLPDAFSPPCGRGIAATASNSSYREHDPFLWRLRVCSMFVCDPPNEYELPQPSLMQRFGMLALLFMIWRQRTKD